MKLNDTLIYQHPNVGEIWIAHNSTAYELYQTKEFDKMNKLIDQEYQKCYPTSNKPKEYSNEK